jgi:hypothetical protein
VSVSTAADVSSPADVSRPADVASSRPPSFEHVLAMSDDVGLFEHAEYAEPRRSHGYCTDDVARLVVVLARQPWPDRATTELGRTPFRLQAGAPGVDGTVRNRRSAGGRWHGRRGVEDCWGRSVWAFGTTAGRAPEAWMRQSGLAHFEHGVEQRSPWPRAMAFAALGAAEVVAVAPGHDRARRLLADAVVAIGPLGRGVDWPWPEARLGYANAALPEALLAAGALLDRPRVVEDGLTLLRWLLERETVGTHLSPTPVGGAGPADRPPAFDQQPIEVAAMADACARAFLLTGDAEWRRGVERAVEWFGGANDAGAVMWDPRTGGGYDGLQANGPNLNQGAESTLALISTLQVGRRLASTAA